MKKVYADNSSTSFPKAPGVSDAIKNFLDHRGCNVNRGGYADAYDVAMELLDARQQLADLFHAQSPQEVIFTPSVTYALNFLLRGFLKKGDHVIATSMEHNAVMRPLHALSQAGVAYDTVPCGKDGSLAVGNLTRFIRKETKAVVMTHASNVCGTIMPIEACAEICRAHHIRLIVDAAQTAGVLDIDAQGIDALAFAGHKGLMAAQGIGGFVVKKAFAEEISPLITGGTGSLSQEITQPDFLPDKFEPGTMNLPGIIGLKQAIAYRNQVGTKAIHEKEAHLTDVFLSCMRGIDGVRLIGKDTLDGRIAVVSADFPGCDNAAVAHALDSRYGIMTRCGLHCAPVAHKTLQTYPHGTVRFSFGYFNTADEVEYIAQSVRELLKSGASHGF